MICSGGGLVAATNGRSLYNSVYADAVQQDGECKKKKVVVLGTGWAGTSFLKNIKSSSYDVQVISPHNYFAFTPLLPSVTCGTVEARSIVEPIRTITKKVTKFVSFKIELNQSSSYYSLNFTHILKFFAKINLTQLTFYIAERFGY